MKAWVLSRIGGGLADVHLTDVPDPVPAVGEVLLDLDYAGLNPADRYLAEGQYPAKPPLPHILGRDGVGRVASLGPGVSDLRIGDQRAILRSEIGVERPGTFAQRVVVPADALVPIPEGWSAQEAAGAPLVYLTAYQALTQWGDLPAGRVVLVTGASGGVGVASIQLAKAMGHTVIALSRGSAKHDALRQLGADLTLDPAAPDWRQQLKRLLAPRRVDLAIDNIGGPLLSDVIDTLGYDGKVSLVGRLAGPVPQFNTASLFFRRLKLGGVAVGTYSLPDARAVWNQVVALLARTAARPQLDRVYPFTDLPPAFARLADGPMGKVLLQVRSST
jgi:NADPH:quinone reductase